MEAQQSTTVISNPLPIGNGIKDSCRICMGRIGNMRDIFDKQSNIIDHIEYCTGILVTEENSLPSIICETCLSDLSVAHKFKTTCVLANNTYRKLILTNIKVEVTINEYDNTNVNGDDVCDSVNDVNIANVKVEDVDVNDDMNGDVKLFNDDDDRNTKLDIGQTQKTRKTYKENDGPKKLKKFKFRRLMCEPCGLKFKSKKESIEHKQSLHKDNQSWVCEVCGKKFVHRGSLYSHTRSHFPPQFSCDKCDYRTSQKHDLAKHVRIHTGIKQYQCHFCIASYHTSSNLSCHIRRCHEGQKRFPCHLCDRKFFDRTKLNRHIDSHNEIRRFECDICHSFFTRRCYWKKHLFRQHSVVVPPQRPGRKSKWDSDKLQSLNENVAS